MKNKVINVIKVGIAELKTVSPPDVIRTNGLGSCVGVVVYDQRTHFAGMAHVMLPDSSMAKEIPVQAGKYADTAVAALYEKVKEHTSARLIKAKIAGGAQMFQLNSRHHHHLNIGERNVNAIKKHLQHFHIDLVSEDVGGNSGRTIEFDPHSFTLKIKKFNVGLIEI